MESVLIQKLEKTNKNSTIKNKNIITKIFYYNGNLWVKNNNSNNIYFDFFIMVVFFIQINFLYFDEKLVKVWNNDGIINIFSNYGKFIYISSIFKVLNFYVYLSIYFLYWILFILFIVTMIYNLKFYETKKEGLLKNFSNKYFIIFYKLSSTILFYFIIDMNLILFRCKNNVNVYFNNFKCLQIFTIFLQIIAIFNLILFTIVEYLILIDFDFKPKHINEKKNNKDILFLNQYYYLMILLINSNIPVDYYLFIGFICILLLHLFYKYKNPYYNYKENIRFIVFLNIHFWTILTCLLGLFALKMKELIFIYFIIIILIICIKYTNTKETSIPVLKYDNSNDIFNSYLILIKFINYNLKKKGLLNELNAFLNTHLKNCKKLNCIIKSNENDIKLYEKQYGIIFKKLNNVQKILVYLNYKILNYGIKKYPENIKFKIYFCYLLNDFFEKKTQLLSEISKISKINKNQFINGFLLYRIKFTIKEEENETINKNNTNNDSKNNSIITKEEFNKNYSELIKNINNLSLTYYDFLNILLENKPESNKFFNVGNKVIDYQNLIDIQYNKLIKNPYYNYKVYKLLGNLHIEVYNEIVKGNELLELSKKKLFSKSNQINLENLLTLNDVSEYFYGIIMISGDKETLGIILKLNSIILNYFGYQKKNELINQNVKVIMPRIFQTNHDSYWENFSENKELKAMKKERKVFGRNKNSYCFPLLIDIKHFTDNKEKLFLYATFKRTTNYIIDSYILTNYSGIIDSISPGCIKMLNIDNNSLNSKIKIEDYFPNILNDLEKYSSIKGETIDYKLKIGNSFKDIKIRLKVNKFFGAVELYIFNFQYEDNILDDYNEVVENEPISKFQFNLNSNFKNIVGEKISNVSNKFTAKFIKNMKININNSKELENISEDKNKITKSRYDYSLNINTFRLTETPNKFIIISNDDQSLNESQNSNSFERLKIKNLQNAEEEEDDEVEKNYYSEEIFLLLFKNKEEMITKIKQRRNFNIIRRLYYIVLLYIILNFSIILTYYFLQVFYNNKYLNILNLIKISYNRQNNIININSKFLDISLANNSINIPGYNASLWKNDILKSIENLRSNQNSLRRESLNINIDSKLNIFLTEKKIKFKISPTRNELYDLNEANNQILVKSVNLNDLNINTINFNNNDIQFLLNNSTNDLFIKNQEFINLLTQSINYYNNNSLITNITIFSTYAVIIIIIFILFLNLNFKVNKIKLEIFNKYFYLNKNDIIKFTINIQIFIDYLKGQTIEDDDIDIKKKQIDDEANSYDRWISITRKFKNIRNNIKINIIWFFEYLLTIIVILSILFIIFSHKLKFSNIVKTTINEFNSTCFLNSYFDLTQNSFKIYLNNLDYKVLNKNLNENINNIYEYNNILYNNINNYSYLNKNLYTNTFNWEFNQIMYLNPCNLYSNWATSQNRTFILTTNDCKSFASYGFTNGFLIQYNNMIFNFKKYFLDKNYNCPSNDKKCLLNKDNFKNLETFINYYWNVFTNGVIGYYINFFNSKIIEFNQISLISLLILFLFYIFIILLFLIPEIQKINSSLRNSNLIVTLIPFDKIISNYSLRKRIITYFNKY